jgi:tRNA-dihydrouridine synthase B
MDAPAAKELLTQHTQEAIAAGVFGVPSYAVDDRVFWGLDALPMLRAYLEDDPSLAAAQWQAVADYLDALGQQMERIPAATAAAEPSSGLDEPAEMAA